MNQLFARAERDDNDTLIGLRVQPRASSVAMANSSAVKSTCCVYFTFCQGMASFLVPKGKGMYSL